MARKTESNQQVKFSTKKKRTTIGDSRRKMSGMNKHKRRNYKVYRGQGKH